MPKSPSGTKRLIVEDEAQSRRFIDLAHELEEKGELDTSEDGQALDRLVRNAAASKKQPS